MSLDPAPVIARIFAEAEQHCQAGRFDQAVAACRRILDIDPQHGKAMRMLGFITLRTGKLNSAVELLTKSAERLPTDASVHSDLGIALLGIGRPDEAVAAFRKEILIQPGNAMAYNSLGIALCEAEQIHESLASFQTGININPSIPEIHNNLGKVLQRAGQPDEAIAAYQSAIAIRPNYPNAYVGLAEALVVTAQVEAGIVALRQALQLDPSLVIAYSSLLFHLHFTPLDDPKVIHDEHARWNRNYASRFSGCATAFSHDRSPDRRLRIGYVSPYFREHCQSFFTMPLLSSHDHKQFEIVCYADAPHPDAITQRIQGYADKWCNTARMSDQQIADRISADQIDILVDLTMHMDGGRPFLFARKPAPVQMAWLAYPSTTGLTSMDYRLTDPWLDPPVMNDGFYTEQSIRLPETFWCYDPLTMEPSVNALPADSAGRITFGCLNTFCKVNESTLGMWSEVLRALPDSHLILLAPKGASRQRVIQILGIDASRVQFFDRHPRRTYLEWYHQIDIGLDTFPTNGHTTSLDAMWMGVPVVTRAGRTAISRGGLSLLSNIGLTELVATNADEFIRIAVALANDLPRLRELRGTLRDRMSKSVLMDAPRFAHHVEAAYRTMWRRWCESGDIPKPG